MGLLTALRNNLAALFADGSAESKRIGIYGPPNAGKCIAPDESVLLADGTYETIESVFERMEEEFPDAPDVSNEPQETWLELPEDAGLEVPALSEDLSRTTREVTHVFRQKFSGTMYRVRTRLGREVTVSPKHPFITLTDTGVDAIPAGNLEIGNIVATYSSFHPSRTGDWQLKQSNTLASDGGEVVFESTHHDPKSIKPLNVDPDIARFLAFTIAESQHANGFIAFSNEDQNLLDEFTELANRFGVDAIRYEYDDKTPVLRVNSRSLTEHLKRLDCPPGGSDEKAVPDPILQADDDTVRAFLQALFDCEGSVQGDAEGNRGRYVTMSSASRELLEGVQLLLLRFDIVAKIREKHHNCESYFELSIGRSEQHRKFRDTIGFGHSDKAERLATLCDAGSKANVHTLPIMPKLEDIRNQLAMSQSEFYGSSKHVARMRRKNRITIDRIKSMANRLPRKPESEFIHKLAGSDVVWDEIVEIEPIDYDGYIYDLTVEEDHTFPTRDGLILHNTTLANRIARDWTGDAVGPESHIPHETRRARRKENVEIERNGKSVNIDIVDTPGVATKVDYEEFLEHDMDEEEAVRRSREATEGVAEAMHWLREDVDGVIYVLDAAEDPFTQVNTMLVGIIESRDLPVLIFANKIDLEEANVKRIQDAFPQHETVPLSALEGDNMDEVYTKIAEYFG